MCISVDILLPAHCNLSQSVLQVTMLLTTLILLACLLALLFYKDYKIRSRMKLSERIPGPKALPLLGNLLDIGFNTDSKLQVFVFLSVMNAIMEYYVITVLE
jgi:hypothetical protein